MNVCLGEPHLHPVFHAFQKKIRMRSTILLRKGKKKSRQIMPRDSLHIVTQVLDYGQSLRQLTRAFFLN